MTLLKRAVSFVIRAPNDSAKMLVVLRPEDDADLPNVWGLPAASLREGEDWIDAAKRAGCEKLGIELEIVRELNRGELQRTDYILQMRVFEARIVQGTPSVRQLGVDVTQYRECKWDVSEVLQPAAALGSLCCRLLLDQLRTGVDAGED